MPTIARRVTRRSEVHQGLPGAACLAPGPSAETYQQSLAAPCLCLPDSRWQPSNTSPPSHLSLSGQRSPSCPKMRAPPARGCSRARWGRRPTGTPRCKAPGGRTPPHWPPHRMIRLRPFSRPFTIAYPATSVARPPRLALLQGQARGSPSPLCQRVQDALTMGGPLPTERSSSLAGRSVIRNARLLKYLRDRVTRSGRLPGIHPHPSSNGTASARNPWRPSGSGRRPAEMRGQRPIRMRLRRAGQHHRALAWILT